ncbi:rod shape-determining protein MreC [Allosphingosinicella indica]|uniref:Cell shape-determining protein MreC n=1 Tax=Allosphingosinicella indica TaxID=941907 RepID=A0A1X7H2R2_9SPHN|nr:rod shape-determining protein MreC [Allosphingosinicella indica]SMF78418.1 rod shape-determining protein MreC [Allosphingosinicella indica]
MAPPSKRRPGFSRRAQYGLFLSYVVAAGGVILALLLLIVAVIDPRGFNGLKGLALDLTAPVSSAGRGAVRGIGDGIDSVNAYFFAASQNEALRSELAQRRRAAIEAQALRQENRRLKALLGISQRAETAVATGRVVGSTFDSARRLATIDVGGSDGVVIGQPVRSVDGLVGRVVETGRSAARVLLVTDGGNSVPIVLARDGTPAFATGRGDGTIELRTLEVGQSPFRRGDVVFTSGVGGIYPPGIPVARVLKVTRDLTIAQPLADPGKLDFAIVLPAYMPQANAPIAPTAPTAPPPAPAPPRP